MPYASATTTATGSSASVAVPFAYLEQSHVNVTLDGVLVDQDTLEWPSSGQITLPSTPDAGVAIKVYRTTPISDIEVIFSSPEVLQGGDLNKVMRQLLYVTQEGFDAAAGVASDLAGYTDYINTAVATVAGYVSTVAGYVSTVAGYVASASASASAASDSAAAAAASAAEVDADTFLTKAGNLTGIADASAARTVLGLGALALKATVALASDITDGVVTFAKLAAAAIASQAQAEAGSATDVLMTPERTAQAIAALAASGPFTSEFVSSEQTVSSTTALTIAHGLGTIPKLCTVELVCKTADNGYSVGDVVTPIYGAFNNAAGFREGITLSADATNVYVAGLNFSTLSKTASTWVQLTYANWKAVVRAYA